MLKPFNEYEVIVGNVGKADLRRPNVSRGISVSF
jgi:hypothetical protein